MDRLLAIQAFAKVVEVGSFARAAERLNISTSAVSRQVAELEAHLDARLLHRTTRRLSLTEAGQSFYEHAVQLLLVSVVRLTGLCLPYLERSAAGRILKITSSSG